MTYIVSHLIFYSTFYEDLNNVFLLPDYMFVNRNIYFIVEVLLAVLEFAQYYVLSITGQQTRDKLLTFSYLQCFSVGGSLAKKTLS